MPEPAIDPARPGHERAMPCHFPCSLALLIAFGLDAPGPRLAGSLACRCDCWRRPAGILADRGLCFALGRWVASRVAQFGYATSRGLASIHPLGSRLLTVAGLAVYAVDRSRPRLVEAGPRHLGLPGTCPGRRSGRPVAVHPDPAPHSGPVCYFAERALHDYADLPALARLLWSSGRASPWG